MVTGKVTQVCNREKEDVTLHVQCVVPYVNPYSGILFKSWRFWHLLEKIFCRTPEAEFIYLQAVAIWY
jgi:hypothetical protein